MSSNDCSSKWGRDLVAVAVDGPTIATANTTLCAWLSCLPNVFNAVVKKNRMVKFWQF